MHNKRQGEFKFQFWEIKNTHNNLYVVFCLFFVFLMQKCKTQSSKKKQEIMSKAIQWSSYFGLSNTDCFASHLGRRVTEAGANEQNNFKNKRVFSFSV